jgi:hypothetical protein
MTTGVLARTLCANLADMCTHEPGSASNLSVPSVSDASPLTSRKDAQAVVENPAPVIFDFAFCVFLSANGRKFDELKAKENVT